MWIKLAWRWYLWKQKTLVLLGVVLGLVCTYERSLIERLRKVYYGGVPASVLLLAKNMCSGYCYDRATLISKGMDEFEIVWGSIKHLELRYGRKKADHCWVESCGWVYDTSWGFKMKRWLYYLLEKPRVRMRKNRAECLQYHYYINLTSSDLPQDKYYLVLLLPVIAKVIQSSTFPDLEQSELELFMEAVTYQDIE